MTTLNFGVIITHQIYHGCTLKWVNVCANGSAFNRRNILDKGIIIWLFITPPLNFRATVPGRASPNHREKSRGVQQGYANSPGSNEMLLNPRTTTTYAVFTVFSVELVLKP